MHSGSFRKFVNKVTALGMSHEDEHKRPHCKHGPTLLLIKRIGNHEKQFLACSAYRDNKCPLLKGKVDTEKFSEERKMIRKNLIRVIKTRREERAFCRTCDKLFLHRDFYKHHGHSILDKISIKTIRRPTMLLKASQQKEREAQYFFSERTTNFFIDTFHKLGFNHAILIGCPSIHEMIQTNKKSLNMNSILLDIDPRYSQFYLRKHFVLFNMFNNFFFEGREGQRKFDKFLEASVPGKTVLVIDPPFGGLLQAISRTIDKIHARWIRLHSKERDNEYVKKYLNPESYQMGVFIVLPWFLEPKVESFLHGMTMSDYKVGYANHSEFRDCSCKNKFGSAVRIFTNLKPSMLVLPTTEGYKFCEECQKYTANQNKHCYKCNFCTSKDGHPSYHCNICDRCFKNTWVHCKKCGVCALPKHCKCEDNTSTER